MFKDSVHKGFLLWRLYMMRIIYSQWMATDWAKKKKKKNSPRVFHVMIFGIFLFFFGWNLTTFRMNNELNQWWLQQLSVAATGDSFTEFLFPLFFANIFP